MKTYSPSIGWKFSETTAVNHRIAGTLLPLPAHPTKGTSSIRSTPSSLLPPRELNTRQNRPAASSSHRSNRRAQGIKQHEVQCSSAPQVLGPCGSMAEVYEHLTERLLKVAGELPPTRKYLVALAGPPGAGKSTVAKTVVDQVNATWGVVNRVTAKWEAEQGPGGNQNGADVAKPCADLAVAVPMDGFHLYKWQLDCFKDPEEARARRGAPWTFSPEALKRALQRLKREGCGLLPSFDHGVGDPKERAIHITQEVRIVLVEGNYLLLQEEGWREIADLFDEKWFISVDLDEAMERVEKRHVATGKPPDIAKWRISYNDRPNAELIMGTMENADLIFHSVPL